jgi:predicted GTPase
VNSFLLVGNKRDLEDKRTIMVEHEQEKWQKIGVFDYVEISALSGSGIDTMFDDVV